WDAASFAAKEHGLPTLSRLIGDVTDHQWGRALVFAAWLSLGLYLALAWRGSEDGPTTDLGPASRRSGPRPDRSGPGPRRSGPRPRPLRPRDTGPP
ncbi:MAG: hypothetical protein ACRDXC_01640, partial [Acidimicrobiales bacterium]